MLKDADSSALCVIGARLLDSVRALLVASTSLRRRSTRASASRASQGSVSTCPSLEIPTANCHDSILTSAKDMIRLIFHDFDQKHCIHLLKIFHTLENDLVEPFLQQSASNETALVLLKMLVQIGRDLLSRLPTFPSAMNCKRLSQPWENCIKSILLIINSITEHDFVNTFEAFEATRAFLFAILESDILFYRNKLVSMVGLLEMISATTEVKKITRRDHLKALLKLLSQADSVELQLLCVESIYRVLPSSKSERSLVLRGARANDIMVASFTSMESKLFDSSARDLVNQLNTVTQAAKPKSVVYPCTVSAVSVTCVEDSVYFEAAAADQDMLLIFVDIHPDALCFSCKFHPTRRTESDFDLMFSNILNAKFCESKMTAEIRASDVSRVNAPNCTGITTFTFALADSRSIKLFYKYLEHHCPGKVQFVPRGKMSCLEKPIPAIFRADDPAATFSRTASYIQPAAALVTHSIKKCHTPQKNDARRTVPKNKPPPLVGTTRKSAAKTPTPVIVISPSPTLVTSPGQSGSGRTDNSTKRTVIAATAIKTKGKKYGGTAGTGVGKLRSECPSAAMNSSKLKTSTRAGPRSPDPRPGRGVGCTSDDSDKENIKIGPVETGLNHEERQRQLLLASPKSAALLEGLPVIKSAPAKAKSAAQRPPSKPGASKAATNSTPKKPSKSKFMQPTSTLRAKRAQEECSELSNVSSRPKRACGERAVIRMAAVIRASTDSIGSSEKARSSRIDCQTPDKFMRTKENNIGVNSPSKKHATPCPTTNNDAPSCIGEPASVSPKSTLIASLQLRVKQLEQDQFEKAAPATVPPFLEKDSDNPAATKAIKPLENKQAQTTLKIPTTNAQPTFLVPRTPASKQNAKSDTGTSSVGHLFLLEGPCNSQVLHKRAVTPSDTIAKKNSEIPPSHPAVAKQAVPTIVTTKAKSPTKSRAVPYMTPQSVVKPQAKRSSRDAQEQSNLTTESTKQVLNDDAKESNIFQACQEFGTKLCARFEDIERRLQLIAQESKHALPTPTATPGVKPRRSASRTASQGVALESSPSKSFAQFEKTARSLIAAHQTSLKALEDLQQQLLCAPSSTCDVSHSD